MTISKLQTSDQLVDRYFKLFQNDVEDTLALFAEGAVIYEPFSGQDGLREREEIRRFLEVAKMARDGTGEKFSIAGNGHNKTEVATQFGHGGPKSKCEFTTTDVETDRGVEKRIKELRIQFLS